MANLPEVVRNDIQNIRKVIFASSAGTVIEWYDFYIFGALATTISGKFYNTGSSLGDLIAWLATFAIGFMVRPFGALFFVPASRRRRGGLGSRRACALQLR